MNSRILKLLAVRPQCFFNFQSFPQQQKGKDNYSYILFHLHLSNLFPMLGEHQRSDRDSIRYGRHVKSQADARMLHCTTPITHFSYPEMRHLILSTIDSRLLHVFSLLEAPVAFTFDFHNRRLFWFLWVTSQSHWVDEQADDAESVRTQTPWSFDILRFIYIFNREWWAWNIWCLQIAFLMTDTHAHYLSVVHNT